VYLVAEGLHGRDYELLLVWPVLFLRTELLRRLHVDAVELHGDARLFDL
jgi:hypothetical protein